MRARAHDELCDRIADVCWSHALGEECQIDIRDVEQLLRIHMAERKLTDDLYRALIGQSNGPEIAAAIRNYITTRIS